MHHFMFDIDGTLVESFDFDERCFVEAVFEVTGKSINDDWHTYPHITDRGLLKEFIDRHDFDFSLTELEARVKPIFIQGIHQHIESQGVLPVPGALDFFHECQRNEDIQISLATGGWSQTARMKLLGAGFLIDEVTLSSSDDHFDRKEIMRLSENRVRNLSSMHRQSIVYFGDGQWDQDACEQLGYQFIQVGMRFNGRHQQIEDFLDAEKIMGLIQA